MPYTNNTANDHDGGPFDRGEPHKDQFLDGTGGVDWAAYYDAFAAYHLLAYGSLGCDRRAVHKAS